MARALFRPDPRFIPVNHGSTGVKPAVAAPFSCIAPHGTCFAPTNRSTA